MAMTEMSQRPRRAWLEGVSASPPEGGAPQENDSRGQDDRGERQGSSHHTSSQKLGSMG